MCQAVDDWIKVSIEPALRRTAVKQHVYAKRVSIPVFVIFDDLPLEMAGFVINCEKNNQI